ncbi:PP2C family protein-serine/threonine phosphatase [Nocardioides plantarum]|uniref:PP2C family protein-serine/threonine phosphatase n=1 Tax=Nocardioides plantarum TaxID=29299 RepID=UPI00111D7B4B|nr:SpoIIE family protein phosphatase [Nocardioides plantarum]
MTGAPEDDDLFDHAPAAYVVLDRADGHIVRANQAFSSLVRRPLDEVLTCTLPRLLSVAGRIYFDTHLMPMLYLNGRVDEVALDVVTAEGERVPVLVNANRDATGVRVVMFGASERRRYETDLLRSTRAAEAARQAAVELARTLQQTLIPPVPPRIPRLEISAAYRPAGAGDEVGGDFYDVFNVAPSVWTVVLGDVLGKGVRAAAVTSFIRHTVRDLAMQLADPAELLHALDRALRAHDTDKFCTVVLLRLTESSDGWVVEGASGGHPLPLLVTADGRVSEVGTPGSLIGILDHPHYTTFTHRLGADELVTLYTDGVTEARRGRELFGDRALRELLRTASAQPASVSQAVADAVVDYQGGVPSDDIAVLTLRPAPC